ncbi:MAG: cupin domain-containing protein [Planctomycetaceae bacterium]
MLWGQNDVRLFAVFPIGTRQCFGCGSAGLSPIAFLGCPTVCRAVENRTTSPEFPRADSQRAAEIRLVKYPAGIINPLHTHPCGHGMYVLEGTPVTHNGSFGPGTFVWFPEGEVMEHGASSDGDLTVLFMTNKSFRIDYVD